MAAIAIDVQLDVWNPGLKHAREVLIRPDGVNPVAGAGTNNERGRRMARNRRAGIVGKRCWARVNKGDEVGPRGNPSEWIDWVVVLPIEILEENGRRRRQFSARGKAHHP